MRFLLDVKDNMPKFIQELLSCFSFVKAKTLTPAKAQLLDELKSSVDEVNLAKQSKFKLQSAREFLNEL